MYQIIYTWNTRDYKNQVLLILKIQQDFSKLVKNKSTSYFFRGSENLLQIRLKSCVLYAGYEIKHDKQARRLKVEFYPLLSVRNVRKYLVKSFYELKLFFPSSHMASFKYFQRFYIYTGCTRKRGTSDFQIINGYKSTFYCSKFENKHILRICRIQALW